MHWDLSRLSSFFAKYFCWGDKILFRGTVVYPMMCEYQKIRIVRRLKGVQKLANFFKI